MDKINQGMSINPLVSLMYLRQKYEFIFNLQEYNRENQSIF